MLREAKLARAFIAISDTLVDDFEVLDLLTLVADSCVEVLEVTAAGVMLADPDGEMRVAASSSKTTRACELFELQAEEGPCPECYRTGQQVVNLPLADRQARWPRFTLRSCAAGFRGMHVFPMRLRSDVIGSLNLFVTDEPPLSPADVQAAQAFADIATIAILQRRAASDAQRLTDQLTGALTSRVVIEQAKGIVAERSQVPIEQAFAVLRHHARSNHLRLEDVARSVVDGSCDSGHFSAAGAPG